jgi:hypothetical protein
MRTRLVPRPAVPPSRRASSWLPPSASIRVVDGPQGETAILVEVLGAREALPVALLLCNPRLAWLDLVARSWAQHRHWAGLQAALDAVVPEEPAR